MAIKYNAFRNLNKPLYFMGLTPLQIMMCFFGILVGFVAFKFYALVLLIFIYLFSKKMQEETSKGNPDFLTSYLVWTKTREKFIDNDQFFKYLRK